MPLPNSDPFLIVPPLPHERLRIAVTARRVRYVKLGYEPIPIISGRKRPALEDWRKAELDLDTVSAWANDRPGELSTGVRTKYTPGFDIDVHDADMADRVQQVLVHMLRGTILKRTGLPPKRLIPCRCTTPFNKISASFKSPDNVIHKIEVLADGQQFVAEGIHEDTHQPYRWEDSTDLLSVAHEHLPLVDEALARRFVNEASAIMEGAGWTKVDPQGRPKKGKANDRTKPNEYKNNKPDGYNNPYYHFALKDEISALASAPKGARNEALNRAAFSLFQLVAGGGLDETEVREQLFAAAEKCGLVADDGERSVLATIESGAKKGREQPRRAPEQDNDDQSDKPKPPPEPRALTDVHAIFRKWLGDEYDIDAIDATIAAAAAEKLEGDPLWLLIVSGPGAAKTETVQSLVGCDAYITSTIQSEGALLSASTQKGKNATGGLLRKIGDRGILVIKDVTSVLSADRNVRGGVLAALREVYDGRWERNVGSDGGQTLTWVGRIVIVGAVTTAWDTAHAVVAAMGDRFVLIRIDSDNGRKGSGRRAIRNTGQEAKMREELAAAVGGIVYHARTDVPTLNEDDPAFDAILNAADIVTLARTAVEQDYQGEVINSHAPEMPTRFAKQLTQLVRGGIAVGMTPERALELALRCARDSMPPLRLSILVDVALNPNTRPADVRKRINKPWRTVKRAMEALHMLGLLTCEEELGFEDKTVWRYTIDFDFDRATLLAMAKHKVESFTI
jgi:hypothetical protein